jgi:uncharacterized protein (TIGR03435 family)
VRAVLILAFALQSAAGVSRPAFEVASVKPNTSGEARVMIRTEPGGRFVAVNVPLRVLIRNAYGIAEDSRIVEAPGWIETARFDVVAQPPDGTAALIPGGAVGPMNLMLQSLLEERFQLVVRRETRELPMYVLARAGGGTPGPRLRPTAVDCVEILARLYPPAGRGPAPPPPAFVPGQAPPCGSTGGPGRLIAQGMTMTGLAANLAGRVQRIVADKTGLSGNFDLDLEWTPDPFQGSGALGPPPGVPPRIVDGTGLSIFTALREQLGLTLESARGPADVLIIERVGQPSPD